MWCFQRTLLLSFVRLVRAWKVEVMQCSRAPVSPPPLSTHRTPTHTSTWQYRGVGRASHRVEQQQRRVLRNTLCGSLTPRGLVADAGRWVWARGGGKWRTGAGAGGGAPFCEDTLKTPSSSGRRTARGLETGGGEVGKRTMEDSEPAEDGLLAGLRWNRSARDQAQLKHKIRDLPGLLKHGLHLRKKSVSTSNRPPTHRPTVRPSLFISLMLIWWLKTTFFFSYDNGLCRVSVS